MEKLLPLLFYLLWSFCILCGCLLQGKQIKKNHIDANKLKVNAKLDVKMNVFMINHQSYSYTYQFYREHRWLSTLILLFIPVPLFPWVQFPLSSCCPVLIVIYYSQINSNISPLVFFCLWKIFLPVPYSQKKCITPLIMGIIITRWSLKCRDYLTAVFVIGKESAYCRLASGRK